MRSAGLAAAMAATAAVMAPAVGAAQDYTPPGIAGMPAGYFFPCSQAPAAAVVTVPAPFDQYMRVVCTINGHALAAAEGSHWVFPDGTSGFLPALNPNSKVTGPAAYFTAISNAPLTPAETAAFRAKLQPYVKNPAFLAADILRLEVDTSTAVHKQEYFLVAHDASGAMTGALDVECFNDCNPMSPPWGFTVARGNQ
jgi:hypothetical protein